MRRPRLNWTEADCSFDIREGWVMARVGERHHQKHLLHSAVPFSRPPSTTNINTVPCVLSALCPRAHHSPCPSSD